MSILKVSYSTSNAKAGYKPYVVMKYLDQHRVLNRLSGEIQSVWYNRDIAIEVAKDLNRGTDLARWTQYIMALRH